MPLSSEVTGAQVHAVDAQSAKQSGGAPKSFAKLHSVNYPVKAPGQTAADQGSVTLRRSELVHGATTGEDKKFDNRRFILGGTLEDRVRPKTELEVDIKSETVDKYYKFLDTYITNLGKLAELPVPAGMPLPPGVQVNNMLEAVLLDPNRRGDKLAMDILAEKVVGRDGKTITMVVNAEKVKDYLQSADGWAETTMMMEQYALWAELGLGVTADVNHKFYNRPQNNELNRRRQVIADEDMKTLRGYVKSGVSTLISAGGAGLLWVGSRGKTEYDFKPNLALLDALKSSASEADKAYLRAMSGVDIDRIDLNIVGGVYQATYAEGYQPNIRKTESDIGNCYKARKEFFKQLGIDERPTSFRGKERDRSREIRIPEEFIFDPTKATMPEALPLRYTMQIMEVYNELITATPPVGTEAEQMNQRLLAMSDAREKVRVRYAERRIALEQAKREVGNLEALKEKRSKMVSNPDSFRQERKKDGEKKVKEATDKADAAKTKKKELTEGPTAVSTRDQAVLNLERDMIREFSLATNVDVKTAVESTLTALKKDAKDRQDEYEKALKDKADEAGTFVLDKVVAPLKQSIDDFTAKIPAGAKTVAAPSFDFGAIATPGVEALNAKNDAIIARNLRDANKAQALVDQLEAQYKTYRTAVNERDAATLKLASSEPRQIITSYDAYDDFTVGLGLTPAQVRDMPVDDLAAQLIAVPEDERVDLVFRAKAVEAVAQAFTLPQYQQDALTTLMSAGLDPDEIVIRDRVEIAIQVKAYYVALGGVVPSDDEIRDEVEAAYMGMGRNLRALAEARLTQEITYYEGVAKAEKKSVDELGDFKQSIADLDAVIAVMDMQLETYSRIYELTDNAADMMQFVDRTTVTDIDMNYTAAERKQKAQKGVSAWYGMLNEEFKNLGNRDDRFEAFVRIVPPKKLAELLDQYLLYTVPPIDDVDIVFGDIETDIGNGTITGPRMQQAVKQIISYMREYGLAL